MMERSAGILLHISSLPSRYGIGDLGPESYAFADFLDSAGLTYWQILPISPTEQESGNSPYSGLSAFAGNILLISPEKLLEEGFIENSDLLARISGSAKVDYEEVSALKKKVLEKAWLKFRHNGLKNHQQAFKKFADAEADWLDSYSLYAALKNKYGKSWMEWPQELKLGKPEPLKQARKALEDPIQQEKFYQFLFFRQWFSLKAYCNKKGIKIFGDIPFYVGQDSADVWARPAVFKLDRELRPTAVSGVPPDYFSETGQLWGTPVFEWEKEKKLVFNWWIRRLKHSLEIYDLLRLDHFRAFSDYWEVPAGEKTAIHGKWIKGPGAEFFHLLEKEIPNLPLVAEDLGDIDQPVRALMGRFNLPGMRVLQFAFGDHVGENLYAPHNHIANSLVYTGTHDNNTVKGWFAKASKKEKASLRQYTAQRVTAATVHLIFIRLALSSVACIAIVPLQDYLGLGEESIMNRPSVARGNWEWRLQNRAWQGLEKSINQQMKLYGRERKKEKSPIK